MKGKPVKSQPVPIPGFEMVVGEDGVIRHYEQKDAKIDKDFGDAVHNALMSVGPIKDRFGNCIPCSQRKEVLNKWHRALRAVWAWIYHEDKENIKRQCRGTEAQEKSRLEPEVSIHEVPGEKSQESQEGR